MTDASNTPAGDPRPETAQIGRRAIRGFLSLSLGNAARAVLRIALLAILGRLLTPADFGLVAAAGIVVWFSMIFAGLGVAAALIQREPLEPRHVTTAVTSSLLLGTIVGAVMFGAAPALEDALRVPGLTPIIRSLAMAVPVASLAGVAECLLQRRLRFGTIASAELVSYAVGYGVAGVVLAVMGFGVWALVVAEITKTAVKAVVFLRAVPEARRPGYDARALRELLRFGSGHTASGLTSYIAGQGDSAVVARVLGATALGYYGRAIELMLVPAQALGMVLDKVLFPTMALVQHQPELLRLAYRRSTALVALLVLPLSAVTVALAPEIVRALLGPGWEGAVTPLRILAVGMYFRVGYMVGNAVAHATGAVHQTARRNVVYAALIVAGSLAGASWGIDGVAAGVLGAVLVNFVMVFRLADRITRLTPMDFLSVHVPASRIALLLGAEAWAIAVGSQRAGAPALATLAIAVTVMSLTMVLWVRLVPDALGPEGQWMAESLHDRAPRSLRPLLRRVMARAS